MRTDEEKQNYAARTGRSYDPMTRQWKDLKPRFNGMWWFMILVWCGTPLLIGLLIAWFA